MKTLTDQEKIEALTKALELSLSYLEAEGKKAAAWAKEVRATIKAVSK